MIVRITDVDLLHKRLGDEYAIAGHGDLAIGRGVLEDDLKRGALAFVDDADPRLALLFHPHEIDPKGLWITHVWGRSARILSSVEVFLWICDNMPPLGYDNAWFRNSGIAAARAIQLVSPAEPEPGVYTIPFATAARRLRRIRV